MGGKALVITVDERAPPEKARQVRTHFLRGGTWETLRPALAKFFEPPDETGFVAYREKPEYVQKPEPTRAPKEQRPQRRIPVHRAPLAEPPRQTPTQKQVSIRIVVAMSLEDYHRAKKIAVDEFLRDSIAPEFMGFANELVEKLFARYPDNAVVFDFHYPSSEIEIRWKMGNPNAVLCTVSSHRPDMRKETDFTLHARELVVEDRKLVIDLRTAQQEGADKTFARIIGRS